MAGAGTCGEAAVLDLFRSVEGGKEPFDHPVDVSIPPIDRNRKLEWEKVLSDMDAHTTDPDRS